METIEVNSESITIDDEIVSGAPCFAGTRVPIRCLFDYLDGGSSIDHFLSAFPSVTVDQVRQILRDTSASLQEMVDSKYRAEK